MPPKIELELEIELAGLGYMNYELHLLLAGSSISTQMGLIIKQERRRAIEGSRHERERERERDIHTHAHTHRRAGNLLPSNGYYYYCYY